MPTRNQTAKPLSVTLAPIAANRFCELYYSLKRQRQGEVERTKRSDDIRRNAFPAFYSNCVISKDTRFALLISPTKLRNYVLPSGVVVD